MMVIANVMFFIYITSFSLQKKNLYKVATLIILILQTIKVRHTHSVNIR